VKNSKGTAIQALSTRIYQIKKPQKCVLRAKLFSRINAGVQDGTYIQELPCTQQASTACLHSLFRRSSNGITFGTHVTEKRTDDCAAAAARTAPLRRRLLARGFGCRAALSRCCCITRGNLEGAMAPIQTMFTSLNGSARPGALCTGATSVLCVIQSVNRRPQCFRHAHRT
jgi:hypothetical protein